MLCRVCGVEKPHDAFYASSKVTCKECYKARVRQRRKENPEVQAYDRRRGNRQDLAYLRKYRAENPNKYKAHTALNNGLRDGKLVKASSCEVCNSTFAVEGHHDDYSKPLSVRWLCAKCHKQWHAIHGEALNP